MNSLIWFFTIATAVIFATEEASPPFGFSKNARIEVRDLWSFDVNAQFNEYAISQDSMELAFPQNQAAAFYPNSTSASGSAVAFDSKYKPGFQVGFVLNTPYDHWNVAGRYQWFRSKLSASKSGSYPIYYSSPFFVDSYALAISSFTSKWNVGIDLIDLYLTRPYYSGKKVSIEPYIGLRGDFFRQHFDMDATVSGGSWTSQNVKANSNSWGVGPRLGALGNGILGAGFSLFGNLATSLLYTRYTDISVQYVDSLRNPSHIANDHLGVVRPIIETGAGLKWHRFISNRKMYVGLEVAYNFAVFFSQNMIKGLIATAGSNQAAYGNLYLQGVSVGGSVIF